MKGQVRGFGSGRSVGPTPGSAGSLGPGAGGRWQVEVTSSSSASVLTPFVT